MRILTLIIIIGLASCQEKLPLETNPYLAFIEKEKFISEEEFSYIGISDEKLRLELSEVVNNVAEKFEQIASQNKMTHYNDCQHIIRDGIRQVTKYDLSREHRWRVCAYFQELLDLAQVQGSEGWLAWYLEKNETKN